MYPKILFHKAGNFTIRDFPLERKGSQWEGFPIHLTGQSVDYHTITRRPYQFPKVINKEYLPSKEEHKNAIFGIQTSSLEKVVLARVTTLTYSTNLDPLGVFFHIKDKALGCWPFAVILAPHLAFVGATPELLYKRKKNRLSTMALAGTRLHGNEYELFTSKALHLEFQVVKNFIAKKLQEISHPFEVTDDVFIKRTINLSHLYYPFEVTLKEGISDEEIINKLHPTPAICGIPKVGALDAISDSEPFDRGWYSGIFSISTGDTKEVYIALRCAQIKENKLHIFTGGGIVKNSNPENEWDELEHKMQLFTRWSQESCLNKQ